MATLIFDLDGTLVLTEDAALECLQKSLQSFGIQKPRSYFLQFVGKSWPHCFSKLKVDHSDLDAEAFKQFTLQTYNDHLKEGVAEVPGATDFVKWAAASGDDLFVVSGSMIQQIELVLRGLKIHHLFKGLVGAEDAAHSKPHPAPYLTVLTRFSLDPSKAWVFEDSTPGIQSAKAANLKVIAVKANANLAQDTHLADFEIANFKSRSFDDWRHFLNKS